MTKKDPNDELDPRRDETSRGDHGGPTKDPLDSTVDSFDDAPKKPRKPRVKRGKRAKRRRVGQVDPEGDSIESPPGAPGGDGIKPFGLDLSAPVPPSLEDTADEELLDEVSSAADVPTDAVQDAQNVANVAKSDDTEQTELIQQFETTIIVDQGADQVAPSEGIASPDGTASQDAVTYVPDAADHPPQPTTPQDLLKTIADVGNETIDLQQTANLRDIQQTIEIGDVDVDAQTQQTIDHSLDSSDRDTAPKKLDRGDISQTINPRELADDDADFWGSLLNSDAGGTDRSDLTQLRPAIERSISETNLQIRARDVVTPRQPATSSSDYRLIRLLGKGGMGNVFVAKQSSLDRLIAVKVIKPLDENKRQKLKKQGRLEEVEQDRRHQFLSEAVVTGDLDHPNIVP
ncbi:MAG: hypothetical protein HKN47_13470, partial [Pirellulaceae bacterium]|nr:hypothetical protein [Pirellulaceae bacterium]